MNCGNGNEVPRGIEDDYGPNAAATFLQWQGNDGKGVLRPGVSGVHALQRPCRTRSISSPR